MSDVNTVLTDLIGKAVKSLDSAVAFSQAQIPDIVHQLLVWNCVQSLTLQFISIVIIISSSLWIKWSVRKVEEEMDRVWIYVAAGTFILLSFVLFIDNFDWLKIWLAPKLYLLEYAASLVK